MKREPRSAARGGEGVSAGPRRPGLFALLVSLLVHATLLAFPLNLGAPQYDVHADPSPGRDGHSAAPASLAFVWVVASAPSESDVHRAAPVETAPEPPSTPAPEHSRPAAPPHATPATVSLRLAPRPFPGRPHVAALPPANPRPAAAAQSEPDLTELSAPSEPKLPSPELPAPILPATPPPAPRPVAARRIPDGDEALALAESPPAAPEQAPAPAKAQEPAAAAVPTPAGEPSAQPAVDLEPAEALEPVPVQPSPVPVTAPLERGAEQPRPEPGEEPPPSPLPAPAAPSEPALPSESGTPAERGAPADSDLGDSVAASVPEEAAASPEPGAADQAALPEPEPPTELASPPPVEPESVPSEPYEAEREESAEPAEAGTVSQSAPPEPSMPPAAAEQGAPPDGEANAITGVDEIGETDESDDVDESDETSEADAISGTVVTAAEESGDRSSGEPEDRPQVDPAGGLQGEALRTRAAGLEGETPENGETVKSEEGERSEAGEEPPAETRPGPGSAAPAGSEPESGGSPGAAAPLGFEDWDLSWQGTLARSQMILLAPREEAAAQEQEAEPEPPPAENAEEIVPPRLEGRVTPPYPPRARRQGIEGDVLLEVDLDETGVPRAVRVIESSGRLDLDAAAVEAVKAQRFIPATQGGRPIPFTIEVPVAFRLTP